MPQIVQQGSLNATALIVPDLYVNIVPPSILALNGVPSNTIGVVGTATWGPVNQAVVIGTMADYARNFGAVQARKYDMGTQVATAVQQGAQAFRGVRVTDGTDAAATSTGVTGAISFVAKYTGTLGNYLSVQLAPGSAANTWKAIVQLAPGQAEVFDNIAGTGNAFWVNLAAAINLGTNVLRGPSLLVIATAGAATTAPSALMMPAFTGGTDGATTITAAVLIGQDTLPRKGMYALRGQGCSIGVLADADDSTQWTTQAGFGLSEGVYMILTGPSGDTITNAITTKQTAGLDSYACKLMFGDWLYWNDQTNQVLRLVSPQGFTAGRLGNLSPEQSSLNKQLYGVVGSQKSGQPGTGQASTYASADLQALFAAGIDVIANPQPGGAYWGVRCGHNSSSNAAINGDNYTRMTNYIAATLAAGMGQYVGEVITADLLNNIASTEDNFLANMQTQGMINDLYGQPYNVVCNLSNNPQTRTQLGYVQSDAQVRYAGIDEKFIANLQGGVTVTPQSTGVTIGGAGT